MRRVCTILLLLAVAGGCAPPRETRTADGRLLVSYWEKWTGFEGEAMQTVVDDFNASQRRYEVRMLTVSQIDQKLMLAAAGGNPPDVAGLWSHSVPDFAEKGALMPIDGRIAAAGITAEAYMPVFWDLCRHRGFQWALPTTPATLALHWNKRLFREAGLDPERPPRSLAELDAMAERLTVVDVERDGHRVQIRFSQLTEAERAAKRFRIVVLGFAPSDSWWKEMWGYWFGGRLSDGERRITAAEPENIEAFRWFQSYTERYGLENLQGLGASFGNFASPQNPFLSGKLAMVLQGVWMHNFVGKYAPHLEWGAAPFPSVDPVRLPNVTVAECDVLVIPKGAREADGAFAFMRFVNRQESLEKLALAQRKFSPLRAVSEDFWRRHPNPYIRVFVNLAASPNARYVPRLTVWQAYKDEMIVATDRIYSQLATPAAALEDVERRVQRKYDRILRRWDQVGLRRLEEWRACDDRR